MKKTKQCEITGVNAAMCRKAVAHWKRERKKAGLPLDKPDDLELMRGTGTYVSMIPPPPIPGTDEYYRCMNQWYQCYMQASYLDSYMVQIANLEAQVDQGFLSLQCYIESYATCIGGAMV